ncbi:peptidase M48 [Massilia arenosa]|uniref:Peptidase M48 n=1 Tax=Zemynaea arenosa TaxID=2561931 RepID=A0A4Y9RZP2_9BURK|nr:M48 family metallopeptidase [Massilia arenosa]TFW13236.1 peptidase M48 [Massilia arenosa]
MTRRLALLAVSTAILLAACATKPPTAPGVPAAQQPSEPGAPAISPKMAANVEYLTKVAALQDRLYQVAAPLLIQNAELCKSHARNLLGFTAKNRFYYPGEYNEASHLAFNMGDQLQVTGVLAGSGAAHAGLKRGDGLVAAEGKPLPTGANASTLAGSVFGPLVSSKATINLTINRDGDQRDVPVPVTRACAFAIELGNADNVNSYADGNRVLVTRGMMNFTQNNDELAYVLARGMAHNLLGHAQSQRQTGTLGSLIDNLVSVRPDLSMLIGSGGIKAMPSEADAAADNLAVFLVARAGYKVDGIDDFWKRLAAAYPASVLNGYVANHPSTQARLAAIAKAQGEVKSKRAAKQPLVP